MDAATRIVLMRLGFTAAIPRDICHGLSTGCVCKACRDQLALIAEHRAAGRNPFLQSGAVRSKPAPVVPVQPWETRAA